MNAHDRHLEDRAATLTVERLSGRTYRVSSGSGGEPHIVRGAAEEPLSGWTCDCVGARGTRFWCSHKAAVAQHLLIPDRPYREPAKPRRQSMTTERPQPAASSPVGFEASIPLIQSAVKVAGDGGVRLTIDVPDSEYDAVMDFVRQARGRTFLIVPAWITEEMEVPEETDS